MRYPALLLLPFLLLPGPACMPETSAGQPPVMIGAGKEVSQATETGKTPASDVKELFSEILADGFEPPFEKNARKSWKGGITHGDDINCRYKQTWEYKSPGTTLVCAIAKGVVIYAEEEPDGRKNTVYIQHQFLENAKIRTVYSLYTFFDELRVKQGDTVSKGQPVGLTGLDNTPASFIDLNIEIHTQNMKEANIDGAVLGGNYDFNECPSHFIRDHAYTLRPATEKTLLIAIKHEYKMQVFEYGKLTKTCDIALSQSPLGHKQAEGDNKLPEGEYRIIQKTKGPFAGSYSEFLGPRFMRLNYPNSYDAEAAWENKKITLKQRGQIIAANKAKKEPSKHTGIGGGIGIHGWAGDWPSGPRHLTWGCISMKNKDLLRFFDEVPLYTHILIFP